VEVFFPIQRALWIASMLAEALLVVRFFQLGLVRKYPFFVAFLTEEVAGGVALMQYDMKSRSYAQAYRICTLILIFFRMGVAAELYERICEHFPGIGVFRAVMASVLVLLAGLAATFSFRPNIAPQWAFPQTLPLVILRWQGEILGGAFILTWLFLRYVLSIRQPFRPNVLTHWTIAAVYFGTIGAMYLAVLLGRGGNAVFPINIAMQVLQIGCFLAWMRFMRRSGEELPAFPRLLPHQIQAVEDYNRELLRTVTSLPDEISTRR
jgi:hypothetical protein